MIWKYEICWNKLKPYITWFEKYQQGALFCMSYPSLCVGNIYEATGNRNVVYKLLIEFIILVKTMNLLTAGMNLPVPRKKN
jgi:hypothetical protein